MTDVAPFSGIGDPRTDSRIDFVGPEYADSKNWNEEQTGISRGVAALDLY